MGYRVELTELAKNDLLEIAKYLSSFYPETASKALDDIWEKFDIIEDNPHLYPCYEKNAKLRKAVATHYLIFYHPNDETKQAMIYRVIRASWNVEQHLNNYFNQKDELL